jgi:membrane-bound metal-dependent hydrolase YbcI (DUF457 family)
MTVVGHSFVGATVAVAIAPWAQTRRARIAILAAFALLANVPDWPLPGWGHDLYDVSHSVFTNLGLMVVAGGAALCFRRVRRVKGLGRLAVGGVLAWASHFVLDATYNHGRGIRIFWPFSRARLTLTLPWFETLRQPVPDFHHHAASVFGIEMLVYGSIFVLVCAARGLLTRSSGATVSSS